MDLIDIYRTFHPKVATHTFFSSVHGTLTRIDHMLGYKGSLSKFEKTGNVSSICSEHSSMRIEKNYKIKDLENANSWRLNNILLNSQ